MKKIILSLLAGTAIAASASAQEIANFRGDYTTTSFATGWTYQWNATGFNIGDSANYENLVASGNNYVVDSPDANDLLNSVSPVGGTGNFLSVNLNTTNGSVNYIGGETPASTATDTFSHYVILGYTVQAGEAGDNATFEQIGSGGSQNGGTYLFYKNDTLINTIVTAGDPSFGSGSGIDMGTVVAGDTLYLAYLQAEPGTDSRNANRSFVDYNISLIPEPSTYALLGGLTALSFVMVRRRK
ncbi:MULTISPECIES: PEP-CTERM sorting domain-containing protein [unclassified Lentimonas]|uniref:PEP-CTERM sorting domain-containing protein n=1 Tax=unclassified Lentimonas TaxID=2630993 RepID=UPI0013210969|nr:MULTISPECIES: PEP-CTERM sorting domain-containing protein [unclassified Lentimonas]CAA6692395.1 Unannotated [Lentimonas sp. CC19]CAA6693966.1 Unannotated [Lentimonas sp. CC10]CAA7072213.1 Unannotated [Lentimonas sp. CC11]